MRMKSLLSAVYLISCLVQASAEPTASASQEITPNEKFDCTIENSSAFGHALTGVSHVILVMLYARTKWGLAQETPPSWSWAAYGKATLRQTGTSETKYDLKNYLKRERPYGFFDRGVNPSDFTLEIGSNKTFIYVGSNNYPWPCTKLSDSDYSRMNTVDIPKLPEEDDDSLWISLALLIMLPLALLLWFRKTLVGFLRQFRQMAAEPFHNVIGSDANDRTSTQSGGAEVKGTKSKPLAQFIRHRAVRAAEAIRKGQFDPGHIRDLADSAVCGDYNAARLLAYITLFANHHDIKRQQIEGLSWLMFARFLGTQSSSAPGAMDDFSALRATLQPEIVRKSDELFEGLKLRAEKLQHVSLGENK
jgi:hypothetical protein